MKIPVEQFITLPASCQGARAEVGALNGSGVREKVRIAARRSARRASIRLRASLAGYLILCFGGILPGVASGSVSRVSDSRQDRPRKRPDLGGVRLFLLEGGRGSDSSANTGILYWIWPVKKFHIGGRR